MTPVSDSYGSPRPDASSGACLIGIDAHSPAERAGLQTGDRVIAVDGFPLLDVLDWRWRTAEPSFVVTVQRGDTTLDMVVERPSGGSVGVEFADSVFDGVRECANACRFCFIGQLPQGLRRSLYVRDDDYRLSFLSGTFVTLTNITDADLTRMIEQHLSPLYVSVHAVDEAVRRQLINPPAGDRALERLTALLVGGIEIHTQIVLVPDVNDGAVLDRTLSWLSAAGVASVGIVPLGYTAHQRCFKRSFEDPATAGAAIDQVQRWRSTSAKPLPWVQLADEFYLNAGYDVPDVASYGDFAHYENGIGMVRTFLDELAGAARGRRAKGHLVVVSGTLFAPVLQSALTEAGLAENVEVLAVENRLLGGGVNVTGLLDGGAIVHAIRAHDSQGPFLVPDVVVNSDGLLLDDVPVSELGGRSDKFVSVIGSRAGHLVDAVCGPKRFGRR